jgi:hypothetical protein
LCVQGRRHPRGPAPLTRSRAAAIRAQPVGDLKRLDGKRVLARLTDAVVLLPVSIVMASTEDAAQWVPMMLATLIYFSLCEARG